MAGTRLTITPAGEAICAALGVTTAQDLLALEGGEVVAESRTTKTVRLETPAGIAYLKRYFVPTFKDWFRGALRWTWLGRSKAQREWENYRLLSEAGWGVPERLAWADVATGAGALEGCGILTAEVPGAERLDVAWLKGGIDRRSLLNSLADRLKEMWRRGYTDWNLHARNILVRADNGAWQWFKIDSPKAVMLPGEGDFLAFLTAVAADLPALDAFARHACTPRERWRVLRRCLGAGNLREHAAAIDSASQELQRRERARFEEAKELAGV